MQYLTDLLSAQVKKTEAAEAQNKGQQKEIQYLVDLLSKSQAKVEKNDKVQQDYIRELQYMTDLLTKQMTNHAEEMAAEKKKHEELLTKN